MGVNNASEKSDKRISFALIFGCIIILFSAAKNAM